MTPRKTNPKKKMCPRGRQIKTSLADAPDTEDGPIEKDGLTVRQRLFVAAYTGPAGCVAINAAQMARYKSDNRKALHVTACRLMNDPRVQDAISRAFAEQRYSTEWARAGLVDIASASMANFLTSDEAGNEELDLPKARRAAALGQIKELEQDVRTSLKGEKTVTHRIKLHDRRAALETLMKVEGKIKDGGTSVVVKVLRGVSMDEI